jgi:hypothetical protein
MQGLCRWPMRGSTRPRWCTGGTGSRGRPARTGQIAAVCTGHDYARPGKPKIDWDDPQAKAALVSALVNDANALVVALEGRDLDERGACALALLALVAGQDNSDPAVAAEFLAAEAAGPGGTAGDSAASGGSAINERVRVCIRSFAQDSDMAPLHSPSRNDLIIACIDAAAGQPAYIATWPQSASKSSVDRSPEAIAARK